MTLAIERRTRNEQIGDMLTALEHAWKMQPKMQLVELLTVLLDDRPYWAGSDDPESDTDEQVEAALRFYLKNLMMGTRDRT